MIRRRTHGSAAILGGKHGRAVEVGFVNTLQWKLANAQCELEEIAHRVMAWLDRAPIVVVVLLWRVIQALVLFLLVTVVFIGKALMAAGRWAQAVARETVQREVASRRQHKRLVTQRKRQKAQACHQCAPRGPSRIPDYRDIPPPRRYIQITSYSWGTFID
jgi:hypothetical protein